MYSYDPRLVSNAVFWKAKQEGVPVTHMKLQKLVFFMHAWGLALHSESPVAERPEAWDYGPVFDSLYQALKSFGSRAVDAYCLVMNARSGTREAMIPSKTDTAFWELLEKVWARYGSFTAMQLSALTHEVGSPWYQARSAKQLRLDDRAVSDFYRQKLTSHAD